MLPAAVSHLMVSLHRDSWRHSRYPEHRTCQRETWCVQTLGRTHSPNIGTLDFILDQTTLEKQTIESVALSRRSHAVSLFYSTNNKKLVCHSLRLLVKDAAHWPFQGPGQRDEQHPAVSTLGLQGSIHYRVQMRVAHDLA